MVGWMSRLFRALVLLACVLCAPRAARADMTAEVETLARAHFTTGASYYAGRRWQEALREFEEAYRIAALPAFLYNIGLCEEKLDRVEAAIASYKRYLAAAPATVENREEVQTRVARLEQVAEARLVLEADAARRAPSRRPVYKRGWFWGVIVTGTLVVGGAVALGVGLGTRDRTPTLTPAVVMP
jgi:tetratricopeptide (TPR) repeat protein